ncbi:uncharacterized protein LOC131695549, partial [Topomyia yanbarensis]|uniref:uncharacterized protein LOC131695549 n=1 Tax=Topomyia yanbarensis TaxID=2498891 RepID=UPI00273B516D
LTSVQARNNAKQGFEDIASQHSGVSKTSTKQRQLHLKLQMLDEERKLQEQEDAKRREYILKRYNLLMELDSEISSAIDVEEDEKETNKRVENWINDEMNINQYPELQREAHLEVLPPIVPQTQNIPLQKTPFRIVSSAQQRQPQRQQHPYQSIRRNPPNQSDFLPAMRRMRINDDYASVPVEEDDINNLTRSQVVARQAVSRELPTFSGAPEEWPLFLSSFTTTTNMCGYTPEENLVRLQKCLTSKAHEAVKCTLMHPSNVHRIISTLKRRFGNPEAIVHNLMAKISSTPAPKVDKLDKIIECALAVQNLCATIEACQLDEYMYNFALMRELIDKLPPSIKFEWARYRRNMPCTNLSTFSAWLYELAETVGPLAALSSEMKTHRPTKNNLTFLNAHVENGDEILSSQPLISTLSKQAARSCLVCKGSCSSVEKCTKFAELSYNSKWTTVKEFGLCRKCLKKHNGTCRSQQTCGKNGCEFKHHQLLHNSQRDGSLSAEPTITESECNSHYKPTNKVLFRVIPVILYKPEKHLKTYAFLDDGSSHSFMDAALAKELNIKGEKEPLCLKWTANTNRMENESMNISMQISGVEEHHTVYNLHGVHTVSSLGLFHQTVNMQELCEKYQDLRGIPAASYQNDEPYVNITKPDTPLLSKEDERAQQILATISQTNGGHYVTPLIWKYDDFRLPNSKPVALKRHHCLKTRMQKEPELAAVVRAIIDDYRRKSYIRKLTENEKKEMGSQRQWYIPIFPVFNPNKPGKTRIVWDWAAKTNGVSLNSMLLKGPDQLVPLNDILYKFRENKVGISGDIKEMFLQVLIAKKDQYCQLILWKENDTDQSPSTFVTQVMTFGACCSTNCAQYIKNLNANKYAAHYLRAAEAIIKRHYVDDMLDSVETEEEAIQLAKDVRFIHAQAGFEIRNWLSN